ncbi:hypothetical protein Angca_007582, partial [Angiostrongylus cantonensis]
EGNVREACRFFEVLTSQCLYEGDSYNFANKFFESSVDKDVKIGEGKCVKNGFEKNVRMVSKDGELVAPVLQVVTRKSPFYCPLPVVEFIREHTNHPNLEAAMLDRAFLGKISHDLHGLVVATTHMETNRQFYIHGIEETYAGKQFFETAAGKISIEQYFREKYKRSLRFPRLPLASERKAANVLNYYPLELLVIEPGQRVSSKKLTGTLTERMIQQARILPHEMKKNNRRQLALARLDGDNNEYLSSFRVRISSEFVTSEGKVLAAPEITYKTGSLQPDGRGKLSWKLAERSTFKKSTTFSLRPLADRLTYEALLYPSYSSYLLPKDFKFYKNLDHFLPEDLYLFVFYSRSISGKVSMVMFVTKMRKDPVHDFFKLLEARYKVVTQHVCASTVVSCCQNKTRIIENLLLKFNVKCGGLNHMVSSTTVALQDRTSQRDMNGRLFNGKMFVAFELSHLAALSFYDHQNKKVAKEPTVVGGTSRPVRYTVVVEDKPERPLYEVEHMTHFLCHGHQQSTLPTRIPGILFAAENLAKRGRASWISKVGEDFEAHSSISAVQSMRASEESPDDYYRRISSELLSSLPNHYFA